MGFLCFAINAQPCSQILRLFAAILLQFKLLAVHLRLLKPPPPEHPAAAPFDRPASHVILTADPCPSLLTVAATDLQARIKNGLPIVEFGDDREEFLRCAICLCGMERSEKMRELCNCRHAFHLECLDSWIDEFQITCPVCRSLLFSAAFESPGDRLLCR